MYENPELQDKNTRAESRDQETVIGVGRRVKWIDDTMLTRLDRNGFKLE